MVWVHFLLLLGCIVYAAKLGGIGVGMFCSVNNCTRGQIVTFLYRSVK